jgi:hypothetical protein
MHAAGAGPRGGSHDIFHAGPSPRLRRGIHLQAIPTRWDPKSMELSDPDEEETQD